MSFRRIESCPRCHRVGCRSEIAVHAYNATVAGTNGWGSADTNEMFRAMTDAQNDCYAARKARIAEELKP